MLALERSSLFGWRMPPRLISDRFLEAVRMKQKTPPRGRRVLAAALHFLFGGTCGALLGAASAALPIRSRRATMGTALAYAAGIWAASYAGWVPALRVLPPPHHDRKDRQTAMLLAHLVYGATLGTSLKPDATDRGGVAAASRRRVGASSRTRSERRRP